MFCEVSLTSAVLVCDIIQLNKSIRASCRRMRPQHWTAEMSAKSVNQNEAKVKIIWPTFSVCLSVCLSSCPTCRLSSNGRQETTMTFARKVAAPFAISCALSGGCLRPTWGAI